MLIVCQRKKFNLFLWQVFNDNDLETETTYVPSSKNQVGVMLYILTLSRKDGSFK